MRILIIDQCSKKKNTPTWFDPYDQTALSENTREELIEDVRDQVPARPAKKLYEGRQQQYITSATNRLENAGDDVDRVFISAGFGVVNEDTCLPPYDATFSGLPDEQINQRATELGIQEDILDLLESADSYDVIFFALASDYYLSLDLTQLLDVIPDSTYIALFNHEDLSEGYNNVISLPVRTSEAKEQGTIVLALKGRYLQNFAEHRKHGEPVDNPDDVRTYCTTEYTSQTGLEESDRD